MLNITRNTWYNIQCFGTNRLSLPMSTCKKKKWESYSDPDTRLALWPKETIKLESKWDSCFGASNTDNLWL